MRTETPPNGWNTHFAERHRNRAGELRKAMRTEKGDLLVEMIRWTTFHLAEADRLEQTPVIDTKERFL